MELSECPENGNGISYTSKSILFTTIKLTKSTAHMPTTMQITNDNSCLLPFTFAYSAQPYLGLGNVYVIHLVSLAF